MAAGHDPVLVTDLLRHQRAALREEGVALPEPAGDEAAQLDALEPLVVGESADEPSADVLAVALGAEEPPVGVRDLDDRVLGAWLGRCAANGLGKPLEREDWTPARIRDYLERAGAWPLDDYVPAMDPMPAGYTLREDNWRTTTRGTVRFATRDDDLDYTVLNLMLLERFGPGFTTADVGTTWLDLLPFGKTFTAEAVAYRNLTLGLSAPATALRRNPYRDWVGALIRADVFGMVSPGRPRRAAGLALRDARLSHTRNGAYGEAWAAALVALAFTEPDLRAVVAGATALVPPRSRLRSALDHVLREYDRGAEWESVVAWLHSLDLYYVHVINNAALIAAALLWSGGSFTSAITRTVTAGLDTDSNAATVGAVLGASLGAAALPAHWVEPMHDRLDTALSGVPSQRISGLAARTVALAGA